VTFFPYTLTGINKTGTYNNWISPIIGFAIKIITIRIIDTNMETKNLGNSAIQKFIYETASLLE